MCRRYGVALSSEAFTGDESETDRVVAQLAAAQVLGIDGKVHRLRDLWRDAPTVTLLDLNLPRISGLEVLRRIRADERTKRLPVVILTSSKEDEDIARGYELGANAYVRKPVDFGEFVQAAFVLAGIAPVGDGMKTWVFMRRLLGVPGVRRDFDFAALHPYSATIPQLDLQVEKVRAAKNTRGLFP